VKKVAIQDLTPRYHPPMFRCRVMLMLATVVLPASVFAQAAVDGAAVYEKSCASCHTAPAAGSRAPTREILSQNAPEAILTSLMSGKMYQQGGALTDAERRAVAAFVAGRPLGTSPKLADVGRCTSKPAALSARSPLPLGCVPPAGQSPAPAAVCLRLTKAEHYGSTDAGVSVRRSGTR